MRFDTSPFDVANIDHPLGIRRNKTATRCSHAPPYRSDAVESLPRHDRDVVPDCAVGWLHGGSPHLGTNGFAAATDIGSGILIYNYGNLNIVRKGRIPSDTDRPIWLLEFKGDRQVFVFRGNYSWGQWGLVNSCPGE
jgi:hypothetical protein